MYSMSYGSVDVWVWINRLRIIWGNTSISDITHSTRVNIFIKAVFMICKHGNVSDCEKLQMFELCRVKTGYLNLRSST
jgi:hypothetical protein